MRTIKFAQIGLVTVLAMGGATVHFSRSGVQMNSPFELHAGDPATLREAVNATCGACHNNKTFITAGDYKLDTGANARLGGIASQTRGVLATDMTGGDPLTALIVQKPLAGSVTPHGGIKIPENHPTMQAIIAWVQAGAPAAQMDPPAAPAPTYYNTAGGQHHIVYARRTRKPGGFRGVTASSAGGNIWRMKFDANNNVIENVNLTNLPGTDDAQNPSVSLDGTKVVFSRKQPGSPWKIWEIGIDGSGLRQITFGSGDDTQPWYLPWDAKYANNPTAADPARAGEGGIGFISNRAGFRDEYEATLSMNPYVCDANGGNLRQIDFNPSHSVHPFLHSSGLTIFTRWEHNQHQGHNFMPLFAIAAADWRMGGTNLFGAFGEHGTGTGNSLHDASEDWTWQAVSPHGVSEKGFLLARTSSRDAAGGSIVGQFYPKLQTPHPQPKIILQGDDDEMRGEEMMEVNLTSVTYRNPASLLDGRYVVAVATLVAVTEEFNAFNGSTETTRVYGQFKLQTFELNVGASTGTNLTDLIDFEDGVSFDEPTPVLVRATPPRIGKPIDRTKNTGTFHSGNVTDRQSDGQPRGFTASKVSKVRFIRALQFSQGSVDTGRDIDEGIGTQIVGDVAISPDGSWAADVPAEVPLQFQLLDTSGRVLVNHKPWVQVMRGEVMRCVGCHADHSAAAKVQTIEARQGDPVKVDLSEVQQVHYHQDIQPIWTEKCVRCHDYALKGGAAGGLSLVGRPVPGGETESFQELIGKGLVSTQRPRDSRLVWRLTGRQLNQDPETAYPADGDPVPHDQMLTEREMTMLNNWISAGVNFRVVDDGGVDPLSMLNDTVFRTEVWPILESRCLACHSTGGEGGLAMNLDGNPEDAESEDDVFENRLEVVSRRINFMVPQASYILRKPLGPSLGGLSHVGGQHFTGFDDPQYRTIFSWIAAANPALAPGVPETDLVNVVNHPNPFRDSTIIVYQLQGSAAATVTLRIYSQGGKMIRELPGPADISSTTMGWNRVEWDGKDKNGKTVGNDVYFYAVEAKFGDGTKKLIRGKCVKVK